MHMLCKKDSSSDELESLQKSRNPTTVLTANGEVQTDEEAQENVNDLDLFLTVQILGDTPAVLSLGKLCEEHGYTYEWASAQKPRLSEQGMEILCKTDNFVPFVVPGLSNSGTSSSAASLPQDSSSTFSSPATVRSDDWCTRNLARYTKNPKAKIKGRQRWSIEIAKPSRMVRGVHGKSRRNRSACTAHISHDSESERPTRVASRKHSPIH